VPALSKIAFSYWAYRGFQDDITHATLSLSFSFSHTHYSHLIYIALITLHINFPGSQLLLCIHAGAPINKPTPSTFPLSINNIV